ncbi:MULTISPECIES: hypothetical protein [Wolbachia]|uniref:hypothetical protein n=1 Tax=Wolbachia TaxID=953 RepID=UPI00031D7F63|nr:MULTISPECIES: hypothetical protein [Wolbachia]MCE4149949.1 hypothetical protein [Wolbachia endosymbiont of Drosophila melanogaster]MCE4151286.1 hypothetical protein [Wolbachia endosymbiont of Drosophila melanogaster]UJA57352.1 hypothetical protein L0Z57_01885 [Wolbachia endosymbiont of Aedes aegypti]UJA62986.1 hypothetical protein L0Z60_01885 [Wolbachia endosymbiont of Aedes aegypti]UJA64211.1 hypothetical protein L0Z59_01885 [Wolbachia endosymbiont of Aedes aegypti]
MKNHQRLQNLRSIVFIVGIFLLLFSLAMLIPAITNKCLSYKWKNFLAGFIITCTSGAIFILLGKLSRLHGMPAIFAITSCTWIALSLFAAIPFYFDNLSYVDALFETISGITTTGATILMILKNNLQEYCYGEQCYMAWGVLV